jgi:hypothetical protein
MLRRLKKLLFVLAIAASVPQTNAFSLLGNLTAWQTVRIGYALNMPFTPGGPMNIGEEYRWNVPVVYYGYTPDFLSYFGDRGAQELDKAFEVLNSLPAASQVNFDAYPLTSQRVNHRAQALGLVDIRSFALTVMVQQMGLADPTRFVYTLRNRWTPPGQTNYHVIKRNFDPVTWQNSSYINGQLWTYTTIIDDATGAPDAIAVTEPVDPLALLGFINAPVASGFATTLLVGGFWTGLTRDDVGGLRYIYRRSNSNVENAPPNVTGSSGGGPWGVPGGTNTFVDLGLRPGIDKIEFRRVNYDSLLGIFEPFTNSFVDTIITNGASRSQNMQRPLVVADILFDGADLQGGDGQAAFVIGATTAPAWDNNDDVNGIAGNFGPGVINPATGVPAFIVTFNTVGPIFDNTFPAFLSEQNSLIVHVLWGSFDGTTNEPVVYPINTSIEDVERQVLGGGGQGNPWTIP